MSFLFATNALANFLAMHCEIFRGIDADPYLVAFHAENGDRNLVSDHQRLTNTTRQNQHVYLPRYRLNRRLTAQSIANIGHCRYAMDTTDHILHPQRKRRPPNGGLGSGVPKGIRTPVTAVKGPCPRPLDDGDLHSFVVEPAGVEPAASTMPL